MVETLGEAVVVGWRLQARCDRRRDGLKSSKPCLGLHELDLRSMLWTHGRAYPVGLLPTRLKCPRCGTRHVLAFWVAPGTAAAGRG